MQCLGCPAAGALLLRLLRLHGCSLLPFLWLLLLLPVLVLLYVFAALRKKRTGMRFTNTAVLGRVVRKQTTPTTIKGHKVAASKENPEYIVKSDETGALAAHKPDALRKAWGEALEGQPQDNAETNVPKV